MNKRSLKLPIILLLAVLTATLTVLFTVVQVSAAGPAKDEISAVTLYWEKNSCKLRLDVSLSQETFSTLKGETLSLYELYPYQRTAQITEIDPVTTVELQSASFSFTLDFADESQRLYSKFLLVYEKEDSSSYIITNAHYIDNPDLLAENSTPFPSASSKKGLNVQLFSDAQELGISHTVIDVPINEYLTDETDETALSFLYGNKTYYIKSATLDQLDHRVKVLSDAGVRVSLALVLTAPVSGQSTALDCLYASTMQENVSFYGINVYNSQSSQYLESFTAFLAKRYTAKDGAFGFAGSFLFGHEVNVNRSENYLGPMTLDEYLYTYIAGFRIVDTALRSVYTEGRTYLPLNNNFTAQRAIIAAPADSTLDYSARDFLDGFAERINASGALPWRLAVNACASDPEFADIRTDEYITRDADTPFVSMENIDVLCDYLAKEPFLYRGTQFPILISDFGVSADPAEEEETAFQAAMFAYAYYKAEFNPAIEAIVYHCQVDLASDGYLHYGLWATDDAGVPSAKKPIYRVFTYIDTSYSVDVTSAALSQLGYASWGAVIPGFSAYKLNLRSVTTASAISLQDASHRKKETVLFDFSNGNLNGFYPTDNAEFLEICTDSDGSDCLYARLYHGNPTEYMGLGQRFTEPLNLKANRSLSFTLKVDAPAEVSSVDVILVLSRTGESGKKAALYEGTASIAPGAWQTLAFDISGFTDIYESVDNLKIWVRPTDSGEYSGDFGLWVKSVSVYEKASTGIIRAILLIALIIALICAVFYAFILIRNILRTKHDRAKYNARYRAETDARRRQYDYQNRTRHPRQ